MSNNRTFFKNAKEGSMTLGDIFSDVAKRHSPQDTARVLTAGTALTTPCEAEMLAGWQKPFLFARFFLGYLGFLLLAFLMGSLLGYSGGYYLMLVAIPFLVPMTLLLLVWEMNVPRNISLYEVIIITALGGVLSLIAAVIVNFYSGSYLYAWAGLIEEPAKLIVIYIFLRRKNYKYALNGVLVGAAVGTGFAIIESLGYVISGIGDGILATLGLAANDGMTFAQTLDSFDIIWGNGIMTALSVAIARAVTAVSGHGIFAALYGGALVKAKGSEEIQLSHLLKPEFLIYFAVAILLHALHNYGLDLGLPVLLDGLLPSEYIIIAAIAVCLLLNSLRIGVNQIVGITVSYNNGRVTQAVNRDVVYGAPAAEPVAAASNREIKLQCVAGPNAGQKYRFHEGQSITIGRAAGKNAISVSGCENVSGVHCRISVSDGRVVVTDLNSTNGTYLDNQRLVPNQEMPALNGSVIYLGNKNCAFRIHIQ